MNDDGRWLEDWNYPLLPSVGLALAGGFAAGIGLIAGFGAAVWVVQRVCAVPGAVWHHRRHD